MSFIVVGLGNPGTEYENTRHNTGRIALDAFAKAHDFPEWKADARQQKALVSSGKVTPLENARGKAQKVMLVKPETFMNKSGEAVKNLQFSIFNFQTGNKKREKGISNLVVIHDDLDIPFGTYKISFNKSSGGHKGVESIMRAVKTQAFTRVRIGIASSVSAVKKPQDDAAVEKTILGKFTPGQLALLKKTAKRIGEGLTVLITEGREKAMSQYQS